MKNESFLQNISFGNLESEILHTLSGMEKQQTPKLLFEKNTSLWNTDLTQQKEIAQRLGWLTLADHAEAKAKSLMDFAEEIKNENFTHVVLLGMGGSSLSSEVARQTFGPSPGYPELFILDNTSPEAIAEVSRHITLSHTLFIVASKSGNTQETLSFFRYFYAALENNNAANPGNHFVAITDAGTPLIKLAEQYQFKKIFTSPTDVGGRYSVLTEFGLLPMALMGVDIKGLLNSAHQMALQCRQAEMDLSSAFKLGVTLGVAEKHRIDKVTFILSDSLKSIGYWIEQLLAESTGKHGKGLIPVIGEEPADPSGYGADRIFIHLFLSSDHNQDHLDKMRALEESGFLTINIELKHKLDLGAEFFKWEIATAVASMVMEIDPFDQPNVEESKKNTTQLLASLSKQETIAEPTNHMMFGGVTVYGGNTSTNLFQKEYSNLEALVSAFTSAASTQAYIAILPYFLMTKGREGHLQNWRQKLRDDKKVATTLLSGPRYLHSTGQLHKGGPDSGYFIILLGEATTDLPIPGAEFSFSNFQQAQALGDFNALDSKHRNVMYINFGKNIESGIQQLG